MLICSVARLTFPFAQSPVIQSPDILAHPSQLDEDPSNLDALTPAEAQDIIHASMLWDLPSVIFNSLSFAIVRTYAIVRHVKL